jgi:hypothetical protein
MPIEISGLDPGDHRFVPKAESMSVRKEEPLYFGAGRNTKRLIERRWDDFAAEKESRGLESRDRDIVLTRYGECVLDRGNLHVPAFTGKFSSWVTTRPAFRWWHRGRYTDGQRAKPVEESDLYSVGIGALCFVNDEDTGYLVIGESHKREVGGQGRVVYDTLPAGFMEPPEMEDPKDPAIPVFRALDRELEEEFIDSDFSATSGVMISDYWRNLTACFYSIVEMHMLRESADLEQEGDVFRVKWKQPRETKYGKTFLIPHYHLGGFVSENARKFGERGALLLNRYFSEG